MKLLTRARFTASFVVVLILAAVLTGPITGPSSRIKDAVGIDWETISHREWWSLLTSGFFVDNLAQLIIVLVAAVLGLGSAERLMGTRRTILAFLVTGVAAAAIGLAALGLGVLAGEYWADGVRQLVTVDPLSPILGTVATASAFATVLWRRRIRFVIVASLLVFVLYSGQPADLYRLLAVAVGLLLGALFARRRVRVQRWTSSHHESRVLMAMGATIFALGPVITLISRGRFGLLSPLGMFITHGMPATQGGGAPCSLEAARSACEQQLAAHATQGVSAVLMALLPLVIVLVAAVGLARGRRAAVYVVAAVAVADGVFAAFYFGLVPAIGSPSHLAIRAGQSPEFAAWIVADAILPLVLAGILLSQRRHFRVRASRRVVRRFWAVMGIATAAAIIGYLAFGVLVPQQFAPSVGILDLIADLPERFIPVSFLAAERSDFVPVTLAARLVYHGVGPALWAALLVALVPLVRGHRFSAPGPDDGAEFRRLARVHGDSVSFTGTWVGNSYWFDDDRRGAIAYRVVNGCAVTTGAMVGDPLDRRESLGAFIRFCDTNAWTPVFYSVHPEWAALLEELGWSTTVVAEETVIDPAAWDMTGKKWQDVRSSINRAGREGVRVVWTTWAELSTRTANQIAEISELWVVEKKLPELGFTLGTIDELDDPDVLLGLAIDNAGTVQAVTSWLPTWTNGVLTGRTLDFMRRRPNGMNGVMEFLIAEAATRARHEGLAFLSLSGAPLAITETDERSGPVDRVLAWLGRTLEPVYGFRSLLTFKQKFRPRLVPLSLAYPDALSLPAVAIAVTRCYLPDLGLAETAAIVRGVRAPAHTSLG